MDAGRGPARRGHGGSGYGRENHTGHGEKLGGAGRAARDPGSAAISQIRSAQEQTVQCQQVDHFRRPAGSSGISEQPHLWDRRQEQHVHRTTMGAVGLQLHHLTGRDLLLTGPTFQELGVNAPGAQMAPDANGTNGTLFARQAFMLVRNFLVPNLTIKAGRQLVVWGNHRMFGHFDWNNVGWAHDGLTANYKLSKSTTLQVGWLRTAERNCRGVTTGNCITNNAPGTPRRDATDDGNVVFVRAPMKVAGVVLEPTYIWHDGGTGGATPGLNGGINDPRPQNQSRHTLGGRAVKKFAAGRRPRGRHDRRLLPIRGDRYGHGRQKHGY